MCCSTHAERDAREFPPGKLPPQGLFWSRDEDPQFRCQCRYGVVCMRRAAGEDFMCAWCSPLDESGHIRKCQELQVRPWFMVL